jgi:hypothetical protein
VLFALIISAALSAMAWAALITGPAVMLARLISRALVRLIKGK